MTLDTLAGALVALVSWPVVWAAVTKQGRLMRSELNSRRAMARAFNRKGNR